MISKPFGTTIFCDDIRNEVGGSITIVGANANDEILFPKPTDSNSDAKSTCMIPILAFYLKIIIPITYKFKRLNIKIIQIENTKENNLFEAHLEAKNFPDIPLKNEDDEPSYFKLNIAQRIPGVTCRPQGKIKSRMVFDQHDPIPLGTLVYKYER